MMATSSLLGRHHPVSASSHSYEDMPYCRCHFHRRKAWYSLPSSFFPQCSSSGSLVRHGKLACECSKISTALVMSFDNMPGRVETPVDAGIKLSDVEFNPDILDIQYRANNRAAPPVVPCYSPSDESNGPTELDFEIYASNSMENYEPPPPPRIPFSFPFEDYYGETVGVDYISKENRPANSLLRFLDSLNAKKMEEHGENTKKIAFPSSSSDTDETAEAKAQHAAEGSDGGKNMKDITDDSSQNNVSSHGQAKVEGGALSPSLRCINQSSERSSVSLPPVTSEMNSINSRALTARSSAIDYSLHPLSSTVMATIESADAGRAASPLPSPTEKATDSRSSGDLRRRISPFHTSNGANEEVQANDISQSGIHQGSDSSASMSPGTRLSNNINTPVPCFSQHKFSGQSKGNLVQRGYDHETGALENAELSHIPVDQMPEVASTDIGRESLTSTQALDGSEEAVPMSPFYVPQEGDLVIGAVTFANDQKVDVEIGAELSALMPTRDLQPNFQHDGSVLFEISSKNGSSLPLGQSLLVKEDNDISNFSRSGMAEVGTIVVAEVVGKTIIDGRAILSCKSSAQKLAWHRIDQLMRLGETVQIKIMQWNEGGLLGYFEGVRAFIPRSELLQKLESTAFLKDYVGRMLTVAVVQNDRQRSNIIASEVQGWMSKNLQLGTVHNVTVTRVHTFGIQVEIDNTKIRGFVHKTNFSKEYVSSVANYFAEGDKARVMLIKGRDPRKVSFSLADLEREDGLLLRDKEQVFRDAEEMARRFRERLSEQEKRLFGLMASDSSLDYKEPEIANIAWLYNQNAVP